MPGSYVELQVINWLPQKNLVIPIYSRHKMLLLAQLLF